MVFRMLGLLRDFLFTIFLWGYHRITNSCLAAMAVMFDRGCKDQNFLECISPTESKFSPVWDPGDRRPHVSHVSHAPNMGWVKETQFVRRFLPLHEERNYIEMPMKCSKPKSEPSIVIPKITINGYQWLV